MKIGPAIVVTLLVATACGQAQMGGGSGSQQGASEESGGEGGTMTPKSEDPVAPQKQSDDDAIAACLEKFGNHPFGSKTPPTYRKLDASVQVLGFGSALIDRETTDRPSLVLIAAAVNVLGSPKYELLNPNGWYCIKVGVNVKTSLEVQLACSARLADNRVNVGVLSDSEPTAAVGVDVLSDVKVRRVGACSTGAP